MRCIPVLTVLLLACSSSDKASQPTAVATYLDGDAVAAEHVGLALASFHSSTTCSLGCTVHVAEADASRARDELRRKNLANVSVIE